MRDTERVEERAHHRPPFSEVIEDQRARRQRVGQCRQRSKVARLAVLVERDDGFGPEFLLLRDQQRRLDLIVGGRVVAPERARRLLPLIEGHPFPQPRRREERFAHIAMLF